MNLRKLIGILLTFIGLTTYGQLIDNFDDGDLNKNPTWSGNLNHFITTSEGRLRLAASSAGKSSLTAQFNVPDSFQLSFDITLDFSPSTSNYVRVHFLHNNLDSNAASSYYLNFGENGNADAIRLYKQIKGVSTLLASGTEGKIANNSNNAKVTLTYRQQTINMTVIYNNDAEKIKEFTIKETILPFASTHFKIECVYTSTRTDKFYFDDLAMDIIRPDITPPIIIKSNLVAPNKLEVICSEDVKLPTITQLSVSPNINIGSIEHPTNDKSKFVINFSSNISEGIEYKSTVTNLEDLNGNVQKSQSLNFGLYKEASLGDLILTEILFDPVNGGDDYLEIYNTSDKILDLNGLTIENPIRKEKKTISTTYLLPAKSYLCLNKNIQQVKDHYKPIQTANFLSFTLPSFLNESGKVIITNKNGDVLDSLTYSEGMHDKIINDSEGVSLERKSNSSGKFENTWRSGVESTNFGTPGYANAYFENINDKIELSLLNGKVFSPNGDGNNDEMVIQYKMPDGGYLADVSIFSSSGKKIKNLVTNFGLQSIGYIAWDGKDDNSNEVNMGVYIINFNAYNTQGQRLKNQISVIVTY